MIIVVNTDLSSSLLKYICLSSVYNKSICYSFYTTSLSILNNKEQATYELLSEELKINTSKYNN